jgi:hypothetical protein
MYPVNERSLSVIDRVIAGESPSGKHMIESNKNIEQELEGELRGGT